MSTMREDCTHEKKARFFAPQAPNSPIRNVYWCTVCGSACVGEPTGAANEWIIPERQQPDKAAETPKTDETVKTS